MVLVDTSVWVEVFRKPSKFRLESALDFDSLAEISGLDARSIRV